MRWKGITSGYGILDGDKYDCVYFAEKQWWNFLGEKVRT